MFILCIQLFFSDYFLTEPIKCEKYIFFLIYHKILLFLFHFKTLEIIKEKEYIQIVIILILKLCQEHLFIFHIKIKYFYRTSIHLMYLLSFISICLLLSQCFI